MTGTGSSLARTPLYGLHQSLGAKMVPFAGYEMPVQFRAGILNEHLHTRSAAGLFDVSHMGQAVVDGSDPAASLERLTPGDIAGLRSGRMRYALLLNGAGAIIDDFMAARMPHGSALHLVVNASTKQSDFEYLEAMLRGEAVLQPLPDHALLALQGPRAEAVLSRHAEGVSALAFMQLAEITVAGAPALVSRSGYTGEDGFEISLAAKDAEAVAARLLSEPEVLPIGLGARDTLRLEAGLCLYGHDIDENTTPIEAGLAWTIGKRRKQARDFPGADRIMAELFNGPSRQRVGLRMTDRTPAREGATLIDRSGAAAGRVTSGGFGPTVGAPIAMGYVSSALAVDGSRLAAVIRGTPREAVVTPLPFVQHRYRRTTGA